MARELRAILIALTVLAACLTAGFLWMTSVPGESYAEPLKPLDADQQQRAGAITADVARLASSPHNLAHPAALEAAAQYIEAQVRLTGLEPAALPLDGPGGLARNIEVTIEPAQQRSETLVIGAHYDSAYDAPGANDNASGVAALLALVRDLAPLSGKAKVRLRLVFFVNEEPPYFKTNRMGSLVYAEALARRPERVRGMISLETMGCYSDQPGSQAYPFPLSLRYPDTGNFIAFVATTGSRSFLRETIRDYRRVAQFPSVGGVAPAIVQGIDWSDHWAFEQHGMDALMITDTAPFRYRYYHTAEDTPDKVDAGRLSRVVSGLIRMLRGYAGAGLTAPR